MNYKSGIVFQSEQQALDKEDVVKSAAPGWNVQKDTKFADCQHAMKPQKWGQRCRGTYSVGANGARKKYAMYPMIL